MPRIFWLWCGLWCAANVHSASVQAVPIAPKSATKVAAPKIALNAMPTGAISLRWEMLPRVAGRYPLALHLFCRPKGHSKERATMFGEPLKKTPVTSQDIDEGPSIDPSPFWFDVWANVNAATPASPKIWQKMTRVSFTQTKDAQEILLRWRDPKAKEGPVIVMHFGYTHWHEWETFTFTDEWADTPYHRTFYWGGEGDYYVNQRFDKTQNGRMVIEETEGEPNKTTRNFYRWNGREWLDKTQKFFLIAATFPTRKEAQNWRDAQSWGEVLRSDNYPNLRKGHFVVVLDRLRSLQEANQRKSEIEDDARFKRMKLYVRRAL